MSNRRLLPPAAQAAGLDAHEVRVVCAGSQLPLITAPPAEGRRCPVCLWLYAGAFLWSLSGGIWDVCDNYHTSVAQCYRVHRHCNVGTNSRDAQTEVEEVADHDDNPLLRIAERAAANIISTARSLREAAAAVLIKLGYQIHALL